LPTYLDVLEDKEEKMINIISTVLCLACAIMSICMSIELLKRSRELRRVTTKLEKFEKIYGAMALELQNMTDAVMLHDHDGVEIFYNKIYALHQQFMAVRTDD
jgi:TRAP-type C4-dicarboxylate transport system permease small subunit